MRSQTRSLDPKNRIDRRLEDSPFVGLISAERHSNVPKGRLATWTGRCLVLQGGFVWALVSSGGQVAYRISTARRPGPVTRHYNWPLYPVQGMHIWVNSTDPKCECGTLVSASVLVEDKVNGTAYVVKRMESKREVEVGMRKRRGANPYWSMISHAERDQDPVAMKTNNILTSFTDSVPLLCYLLGATATSSLVVDP